MVFAFSIVWLGDILIFSNSQSTNITPIINVVIVAILLGLTIGGIIMPKYRNYAIGALLAWLLIIIVPPVVVITKLLLTGDLM